VVDKVSTYIIGLQGDDSDIRSFLTGIKSQFRAALSEIEATSKKVELFKNLEDRLQTTSAALAKAKQDVATFTGALAAAQGAGKDVTKPLEEALRNAQKELANTGREFNKQVDQISRLQSQLTRAGIDTSNLAAAELKLAEAARVASQALLDQNNRAALSFKTFRDIQPQVNQLNAAFTSLRDQGSLSFAELGVAQSRLQQQVASLRAETGGLGEAFAAVQTKIFALAATVAVITAGILGAAKNFRDFAQQVAAVDSIADSSRASVDRLALGVRELAKSMGFDAVKATRALYEIISSGIPAENSLQVLEEASKAAVAGLTDVDTAARVGVQILNGYRLEISQLSHVYDVMFQTVKDGIVIFPELAHNLGVIIPPAAATKTSIEELGAAMVVLTRQGIEAPEAATSISRAIIDISAPAPEAAARINDLRLELGGFFSFIEQLSKRKLTLSQIRDIIPDIRAQRAVLALSQNFALLSDTLNIMNTQSGQTQAAYAKLAHTPQQEVERFNAAMKDLSISVGQFITGNNEIATTASKIVNSFNSLSATTRETIIEFTLLTAGGGALLLILRQLAIPFNLLVAALATAGSGGASAATGLTAAAVAAGALNLALAGFLGFEFGQQLFKLFAPVRDFGDSLGIAAARATNLAQFGLSLLSAKLRGNKADADEATKAYQRNAAVLDEFAREVVSGATERLRQLDLQQKQLIENLGKTASAAQEAASKLDAGVSRIAGGVNVQLQGVEQIIQRLQANLQSLVTRLTAAVTQVQALAGASISNINAVAAEQLAALDTLSNSEIVLANKAVAIQTQAASDRLAVLKKYEVDVLEAFNAEAKARLDIAKRTGEDEKTVAQNVAIARKATLQGVLDAFRAHVDQLIALETQHLNKVKSIEQDKYEFNRQTDEQIRAIDAQSLSDRNQYYEKVSAIDRLISEGRRALQAGDAKLAEQYGKQAISQAGEVSKAVEVNGQVIISQRLAEAEAIGKIRSAQDLVNSAFDKQAQAAKDGAAVTKTALEQAQEDVKTLSGQIDELSKQLGDGFKVKIDFDTAQVDKNIADLDQKLSEQDHLLLIKADINQAQVEIARLKTELGEGITVNVGARTEKIEAALLAVQEKHPEITLDVSNALKDLEKVRTSAAALENVHLQLQSNAKEVQAEIDKLKEDTSSTHTIYVKKVELNAAGGAVGWSVQRFANGGPVFRKPNWDKVPGIGDGDTVPALLNAGSFVMRKAAVSTYGDGLMAMLARRFATGGAVRQPGDAIRDAYPSVTNSDYSPFSAFFNQQGLLDPPRLPSDANQLRKTVLRYVFDVRAASLLHYDFWRPMLVALEGDMKAYERAPTDENLATVLNRARGIGLNLGAPSGTMDGFDIDGRKWHKSRASFGSQNETAVKYELYNEGGAASDVIPAMLTPGEFVINKPAVDSINKTFGRGFLDALNALQVPRGALYHSLSPPALRGYASGGEVNFGQADPAGGTPDLRSLIARLLFGSEDANKLALRILTTNGPPKQSSLKVDINANPGDILSRENILRYIIPEIDALLKRAGKF
jgi:TP901 family phage tail tape measure protein